MNKVILQSFDDFNKCLELNSSKEIIKENTIKTVGWYHIIDDLISCLFHLDGKFYIRYSTNQFIINKKSFAKVTKSAESLHIFEYYNNNSLLITFKYLSEPLDYDSNLFGLVENEDNNWGLFLANIINNNQRMDNIINL